MKKNSALMLLLALVVSLASCGNASENANNSPLPPDESLQSDYNFLLAEKKLYNQSMMQFEQKEIRCFP